MQSQQLYMLVGPDRCGKTNIASALSQLLSIPVYKASNEHGNFLRAQEKFLTSLCYADPARLDLIKQLRANVIFDRGYPCEAVYSQVFKRQTNYDMIYQLDSEYAVLGLKIILCTRKSFNGISDDLNTKLKNNVLESISNKYQQFLSTSKCDVLTLYVDDENINRELEEINKFIIGQV